MDMKKNLRDIKSYVLSECMYVRTQIWYVPTTHLGVKKPRTAVFRTNCPRCRHHYRHRRYFMVVNKDYHSYPVPLLTAVGDPPSTPCIQPKPTPHTYSVAQASEPLDSDGEFLHERPTEVAPFSSPSEDTANTNMSAAVIKNAVVRACSIIFRYKMAWKANVPVQPLFTAIL